MKTDKTTQIQRYLSGSPILLAALMTACGPSETTTPVPPEDPFAQTHFLDERPAGAISVGEARATAEPGDPVVISGLIGGALEPFVDGYAAFVLADPAILFCNEMPDEHCATPWDACCEDPDKLSANRISVQFVDGENQILQQSLKGTGGLKELSQVVVTGTISEDSTPDNINLLAQKLYLYRE
jgi:hypothetical protein